MSTHNLKPKTKKTEIINEIINEINDKWNHISKSTCTYTQKLILTWLVGAHLPACSN
jgi:peroxiredoxin